MSRKQIQGKKIFVVIKVKVFYVSIPISAASGKVLCLDEHF